MSNQLRTDFGYKVNYWKIYNGMEHTKSNVRGIHEHEYVVLNAYQYMLEVANPRSKTTLSLDENLEIPVLLCIICCLDNWFSRNEKSNSR